MIARVTGTQALVRGCEPNRFDQAVFAQDYVFLAYGQPSPPRDAPETARPPPASVLSTLSKEMAKEKNLPPTFIPTGDPASDASIVYHYRDLVAATTPEALAEALEVWGVDDDDGTGYAESDIPEFPPLPVVIGFLPTGDPRLDEFLLMSYVRDYGTKAQERDIQKVLDRRMEVLQARQRMAAAQAKDMLELSDADTRRFEQMPIPPGIDPDNLPSFGEL